MASRITPRVAQRRLKFRADEVAYLLHALAAEPTRDHVESRIDQLVGHASAAWRIALRLPADVVAALVQSDHADDDPHCTCNDCMDAFMNRPDI